MRLIYAHIRKLTRNYDFRKNTDASLLPTISWPCFATHDDVLYNRTKSKIIRRLRGNYGFKRFLRDGYGTAQEDTTRRFYNEGETRVC